MAKRVSNPRGGKGRYLDEASRAMQAAELTEREKDAAFAKAEGIPKRVTQADYIQAAKKLRRQRGPMGRRDAAARKLAKATGREITHRTFKNLENAKAFMASNRARKSTLTWWGITAKDKEGTLFAYQSPIERPGVTQTELDNAQELVDQNTQKKTTNQKIKEALDSPDLRITVSTLYLTPTKKVSKNELERKGKAAKRKTRGSKRSGKKTKSSGNSARRVGTSGGERKRASSKAAKRTKRQGTPRRSGVSSRGTQKKRGKKSR